MSASEMVFASRKGPTWRVAQYSAEVGSVLVLGPILFTYFFFLMAAVALGLERLIPQQEPAPYKHRPTKYSPKVDTCD